MLLTFSAIINEVVEGSAPTDFLRRLIYGYTVRMDPGKAATISQISEHVHKEMHKKIHKGAEVATVSSADVNIVQSSIYVLC